MDIKFPADNRAETQYNPNTGQFDRLWLRYGDSVYEPVRPDGDLKKKWSDPGRFGTWWVEHKPESWMPQDDGLSFSWNHDYGEENKPGRKREQATPGVFAPIPGLDELLPGQSWSLMNLSGKTEGSFQPRFQQQESPKEQPLPYCPGRDHSKPYSPGLDHFEPKPMPLPHSPGWVGVKDDPSNVALHAAKAAGAGTDAGGRHLPAGSGGPSQSKEQQNGPNLPDELRPPLAPPGVDILKNMEEARKLRRETPTELPYSLLGLIPGGMTPTLVRDIVNTGKRTKYIYDNFHNRQKYDYKKFGREYADFWNFNYGAYMKEAGFPEWYSKWAAGIAQKLAGTSKLKWGLPLPWPIGFPYSGDDPEDQRQIDRGSDFAERYEKRFMEK